MTAIAMRGGVVGERKQRKTDSPYSQLWECAVKGGYFTAGAVAGYLSTLPPTADVQTRFWAFGGGAVSSAIIFFGLFQPMLKTAKEASEAQINELREDLNAERAEREKSEKIRDEKISELIARNDALQHALAHGKT